MEKKLYIVVVPHLNRTFIETRKRIVDIFNDNGINCWIDYYSDVKTKYSKVMIVSVDRILKHELIGIEFNKIYLPSNVSEYVMTKVHILRRYQKIDVYTDLEEMIHDIAAKEIYAEVTYMNNVDRLYPITFAKSGITLDYCKADVDNTKILYNEMYGSKAANQMGIKDVIFNDPATIVLWNDGTKTVVKAQDNDVYDPEKGLAMAICKKVMGNKGNYYNEFAKWLKEAPYKTKAVGKRSSIVQSNYDINITASELAKHLQNIGKQIAKGFDGTIDNLNKKAK